MANPLKAEVALVKLAGLKSWAVRHATPLKAGAELAGLGALSVPSINALRKKKAPGEEETEEHKKERRNAKFELGGLGVLAVPSAIELAHHAFKRGP